MKKLELKHLAPYLPYQLKCWAMGEVVDENSDVITPKEFDVVGLNTSWVEIHEIGRAVTEQFPFEDIRPLLHPLSRLTEPILEGGNIPVIELEKIMTQNIGGKRKGIEYYAEANVVRIIYEHTPHPMIDPEKQIKNSFFEIDTEPEDITFSVVSEHPKYGDRYYLTGNEFKMYQRLYEWHFDVFGLIEKGLAEPIKPKPQEA